MRFFGAVSANNTLRRIFRIAIILIPPALIAALVVPRVVDVPIFDEWLWAPLVIHAVDGQLSFAQLWELQNAHRSIVPTFIALALALISRWDVRWEIVASLIASVASVVILTAMLPAARRTSGAVVFSLLLFGTNQIENWTWGFQLSWFIVNLGTITTAWALRSPGLSRALGAIAAASVASLSLLSGFSAWIAGGIMVIALPRRIAATWYLCFGLFSALFFWGYRLPAQERENLMNAGSLIEIPLSVVTLIGAPVAAVAGSGVAAIVGVTAIITVIILARSAVWTVAKPWIALAGAALFAAAMIAVARSGGGADEMMTSRYATLGNVFWCAVAGLALESKVREQFLRRGLRACAVCAALLWMGSATVGGMSVSGIVGLQHEELRRLTAAPPLRPADIQDYAPDPLRAAALVPLLQRRHLTAFR